MPEQPSGNWQGQVKEDYSADCQSDHAQANESNSDSLSHRWILPTPAVVSRRLCLSNFLLLRRLAP